MAPSLIRPCSRPSRGSSSASASTRMPFSRTCRAELRAAHSVCSQERLPTAVDVGVGRVGLGPPWPDRLGLAATGQVSDLESDGRPGDHRQLAVESFPRAASGQPGGWSRSHAVATAVPMRVVSVVVTALRIAPRRGLPEDELGAVLGRSAALPVVDPGWRGPPRYPVGAHAAEHLNQKSRKDESDARDVVAGVQHDQHVRNLRSALPSGDQAFDNHADPGGGRGGDVLARPEPYRVQLTTPDRNASDRPRHGSTPPKPPSTGYTARPEDSRNGTPRRRNRPPARSNRPHG